MTDQVDEHIGGCACGAIRYKSTGVPIFSFFCHCRQCQQATGTGHSSAFIVAKETTVITGELTFWDRTVENGNTVSQGFCGKCGSPVLNQNSGYPDNLYITAGSLDDPTLFKPRAVLYDSEAHHWDQIDADKLQHSFHKFIAFEINKRATCSKFVLL